MRQAKLFGSVGLMIIYFYVVILDSYIAREKYTEYSFLISYTKARRARDEANYVYQLSIGLAYLSGLGLFIRPFVCLGGFNFLICSLYHVFMVIFPYIKHIPYCYDQEATDHAFEYMRLENNREKDYHWRILASVALVLILLHWSFARGWSK